MLVKYLFVTVAVVVGGVMAKCDSQQQFDLCKQNMQTYVDACTPNDAKCLCQTNKTILNNCYPLCPQDAGKASQQSIVTSWCVSAGGDNTSSEPVVTPTTTASGSSTGTASNTATHADSTSTPTGSHTTTASPKTTGNAGNMLAPGGFMAAAAAVAGLVL